MNNTHSHNNRTVTEKPSLRGEAPQEQGINKPTKKKKRVLSTAKRAKARAKRMALVAASAEAKTAIQFIVAKGGKELSVNEYLMVIHRTESGCKDFRTFTQWKQAGFRVLKGSTSYDIWGTPRQTKAADAVDEKGDTEEGREYSLFPVCSLFGAHQVERIEGPGAAETQVNNTERSVDTREPRPGLSSVPVAQYRDSIRHLQRVFNVDRHACVSEREKAHWRTIAQRALTELQRVTCARATPADHENKAAIIAAVSHYLAEHPEPTAPEDDEKSASEDPNNDDGAERDSSPFVTLDYEAQQEGRKDRMKARADKARAQSAASYSRAKSMASVIPFGQPILVGHHSESRDRRYRDKIHNTFGQSFELEAKADHYEQKAASVGECGIASNDPQAIAKLTQKLDNLKQSQETMKAVNKLIRSNKGSRDELKKAIVEAGLLSKAMADQILTPDSASHTGFASYSLSNNNAEIRRIRQRIESLERLRNSEPIDFSNSEFSMTIDNGRVCIEFAGGKPTAEVRALLKSSAFKWSRHQSAWVRKATINAVASARRLLVQLQAKESMY